MHVNMKKGIIFLTTLILLFVAHTSNGQSSAKTAAAEQYHLLDSLLPTYLSNKKELPVNNILIYIENAKNQFIYHKAFGHINEEKTVAAAKSDLFKIASTTKTFTAVVVLQLAEEGKIDLEKPLYDYLKDNSFIHFEKLHTYKGKSYGKTITIAQALSHKTGLVDLFQSDNQFIDYLFKDPQRSWIPQNLFDVFYDFKLDTKTAFTPGSPHAFSYSDVNYFLLGLLIEKISGNKYEIEVRNRILKPLALNDTYFEYREPEKTSNNIVETFKDDLNVTKSINTSFDWAGGGYLSSTKDLAIFIQSLLKNKLFKKKETLQKMITDYGDTGSQLQLGGAGYGYGIEILKINGDTYYGHGGYWGSRMLYCPEKEITVCAFVGQSEIFRKTDEMIEKSLLAITKKR